MTTSDRLDLLVIVGPTAVGKTQIAIDLAERLDGEIISADSRYLYRGLNLGTAKPTAAQRAQVPHHLIDITEPDQPWSLAQYREAAVGLITDIQQRGHLPVLVGGTGQYIYSIIEGWVIPPGEADLGLRSELEDIVRLEGAPAIFKRLQELDPVAARSIDPRNVRRVIRALEVTLTTGQPFSAQRQKNPPNYRLFMVGLTLARDRLYQRIDQRVEQMLANGLVAEVQTLAAKGYAGSLPAMSAIGYKQIGMYLRNEVSLAEAIRLIKHDTRTFVRRQGNWFKPDDSDIHWYDVQALDLEQLLQTLSLFFAKPPSKASNPSAGPVVHHHL